MAKSVKFKGGKFLDSSAIVFGQNVTTLDKVNETDLTSIVDSTNFTINTLYGYRIGNLKGIYYNLNPKGTFPRNTEVTIATVPQLFRPIRKFNFSIAGQIPDLCALIEIETDGDLILYIPSSATIEMIRGFIWYA